MGNLSYICSEVKDLLRWLNELKAKADLDFIICEFYNNVCYTCCHVNMTFRAVNTSHVLTVVSESLCDFH